MASKETPKKLYRKTSTNLSSCRLCNGAVVSNHNKNLFKSSNSTILKNAEEIYGKALPQDNSLPHLICRPCERRVENAIKFKRIIAQTQTSLELSVRTKRCLEISPSIIRPSSKVRTSDESSSTRRRSLDFSATETDTQHLPMSRLTISQVYVDILYVYF